MCPFFSNVGTDDLDNGDMKVFGMDHQSLEDKGFDLSLLECWSRYCCLDCRIDSITLFLRFLNLFHNPWCVNLLGLLVRSFTFPYGLRIAVVILGGSEGLILTVLFRMVSFMTIS